MSVRDALAGARTFQSLRLHRNYRLYLVSQAVSQAGSWLQTAAQAWLVLTLTHSAAAVGLVGFWQFAPYTVLGLFGGTLSDRLDNRRTLIWTQAALGLCAAALAAVAFLRVADVAAVYAIAAARGVILVVNNPSEQALMVRMVGRQELGNAISLNSGVQNATRIVGPGLAGVVIATAGVGVCFALNAVSFLAVIAALARMREEEFFALRRPERPGGVLAELAEGLRYALGTPRVLVPLSLLTVVSTLGINFGVLLPILAAQTLRAGAEVYGLVTSLFGLGALAGALLAASLGRVGWGALFASAVGFGLFELLLAPQRALAWVIAFLVLTGVCYTLYTSSTNTMVQLSAPDALQGRVTGLYSYVFLGTGPLGALLTGWLSQRGGTALTLTVAGMGTLVACALAGLALRRLGDGPGAAGRLL